MNKRTFVRRLLALAMATVMLLSAVPAMAAFRDTEGHWAEKTLTEWQEQGLIDGYRDGSFHPNASVTRAEFAKLLNNALNFTAESAISFTDVKESDWFYAEVAKAAAAGYAQGSNGAFYPGQAITRAEAAAMIARAVNLTADEKRADAFKDAAAIPAWAKGSVGAAAESSYMNGYPDGTFGAGSPITRAEAVVTLDRVRKDTQSVTVEKAGTTLENETVAGNLIIAASVGEGNVTLKNMTIRGDLIVRGGGANSVYLDGTKVSGSVQMQKENVHLRLMGSTTLGSVEISQPCRITQDSSFKGALGTVVIDLEKDSSKEIQIEVPAERVEVMSRANVTLHADMEKLVLSKNAEGAQLEIKRGATVGELTADAKVKLTGSGTVSSMVVSASDVTVSGSLSVKKTETEGGAKPPTTSGGSSSGGSSGGSHTPVKRVIDAETVADVTVPYGMSEADAMSRFPGSVMLNVTEGGTTGTVGAAVSWALDKAYNANPLADTVYTVTGTVTIPDGYTYDGTLTVTAKLTVKADPKQTVTGISEVMGLELPNGAVERDAQLPTKVTVEPEQGDALLANVTWTLNGAWTSPGANTFTGTVVMPAGYYYNGETTATITTTVTVVEDGATAQKKQVINHVPLPLTSIGYASTEKLVLAAARPSLSTNLLLQCQDDSYIAVTVPADDWYFTYTPYNPNPDTNQEVSLSMDVALPMGYDDDNGKTTVFCFVEVKKLDTASLESALAAASALRGTLTDSEDAAFADSTKIYTAPVSTGDGDVTNGVRFVEQGRVDALDNAYSAASNKQNGDTFESQAECNSLTQSLKDETAALNAAVKTGTNTNTALYVKPLVEALLSANRNPDAPYHSVKQPLKAGSFYPLFHHTPSLSGSDMVLSSVAWSVKGDGVESLVDIGLGVGSNPDAYGAQIKSAPAEPKSVTFVATAVCTHRSDASKTLTFTFEYTATIGAPIQVNTNVEVTAPRMTSNIANNISVRVPLTGAEYITGIDISEITVAGKNTTEGVPLSITAASITEGGSCTVNRYGLFVPVTASCGAMGMMLAPTSSGSGPAEPEHNISKITITIKPEVLTVDESSGWYVPDGGLTYDAVVWCCNPAITITTQGASNGDPDCQNVSVQIEYAYKKLSGAVVYTPVDYRNNEDSSTPGATPAKGEVYVRFDANDFQKSTSGQDLITCTKENEPVALDPSKTYYIWCNFEGNGNLSAPYQWLNTNITIQPKNETP